MVNKAKVLKKNRGKYTKTKTIKALPKMYSTLKINILIH